MNAGLQQELFHVLAPLPQGLRYQPDFLSGEEEADLRAAIATLPLVPAPYGPYVAKRRIVAFGAGYDFRPGQEIAPLPECPPPACLLALRAKVAGWLALPEAALSHILVTEYQPGTAIGWHRDAPQFGLVAGVSLAGPCRMRFKPLAKASSGRREDIVALALAPRSAYALVGPSRWAWQHSIPAVPALRYSITLRTLRAEAGDRRSGRRMPRQEHNDA